MDELMDFLDTLYAPLLPCGPGESGPPPDALIIGKDPARLEPRYLTFEDLETSMLLAGGPGAGKSVCIRTLIRQLLRRRKTTGEGFTCIDPGNTASWILYEIATYHPELAPYVYYADLTQTAGAVLSYNHLAHVTHPHFAAATMAEEFLRTGGARSSMEKPLVSKVLRILIQTLIELNLTLADAHYFLESGPSERAVAQHLLKGLPETSRLRRFWTNLVTKSKQSQEISVLGPSLRLELTNAPALRRMIAAPLSASFDPKPFMDQGGIGVINLSMTNAGVTRDERNTMASLFVQGFMQAYPKRSADRSLRHTLLIDEAGLLLPRNGGFEECIVEARKFSLTTVIICQALSQLIHDEDTTLHDVCMALPTKLVFGNLPLSDCRTLAEDLYIRELDVFRVKHQHSRLVHDPVLRKVLVSSWTEGESETDSESRTTTRSTGTTEGTTETYGSSTGAMSSASTGETYGDDGSLTHEQRNVARGESQTHSHSSGSSRSWTTGEAESEQRGTARTRSRSSTTAEQWITDHVARRELLPPEFMRLEEQIHMKAQHLRLLPQGRAVLLRPGEAPCDVQVDIAPDHDLTMEQIRNFLTAMFDKPCYAAPEEIDRLIEERETHILRAANNSQRITRSTSGRAHRKQATAPVADCLFADSEE